MAASLSFEQAPPISVPYRFYLTAPLYGVLAAVLLLWQGPGMMDSRWNPVTLAATHLFTLGFLLQIMVGSLLQILPVVAGANVWRPLPLAMVCHVGINLGCIFLVAGFLCAQPACFTLAMACLVPTVALLVLVIVISLSRTSAKSATVTSLKLALAALVVTVFLGALLASVFAWGFGLPVLELVSLHAAWGLLGWSLLLVVGVSYQVVPMFQLTPQYGRLLSQALPWSVFGLLVGWSTLTELLSPDLLRRLALLGLYLAAMVFAVVTLHLQDKRRRKITDPTLRFWRLGMAALLLALALGVVSLLAPEEDISESLELAQGLLALLGVLMSLVCGMLYKIVPFLNWLHLQKLISPVPNTKHMLAEAAMLRQYHCHIAAVVLMLAAIPLPALGSLAGLALALDFGWLAWNLISAVACYHRLKSGRGVAACGR